MIVQDDICVDDYTENAGKMANILTNLLADADKIAILTKNADVTKCHSEVDVLMEEGLLTGRGVVDIDCDVRVSVDKAKLGQMLKNASPWKACKVEKKAVSVEETAELVHENTAAVA